jgi:hypothetical protein
MIVARGNVKKSSDGEGSIYSIAGGGWAGIDQYVSDRDHRHNHRHPSPPVGDDGGDGGLAGSVSTVKPPSNKNDGGMAPSCDPPEAQPSLEEEAMARALEAANQNLKPMTEAEKTGTTRP